MWSLALAMASLTLLVVVRWGQPEVLLAGTPVLGPLATIGPLWAWLAEAALLMLVAGAAVLGTSVLVRLAAFLLDARQLRRNVQAMVRLEELHWFALAALVVLGIALAVAAAVDPRPAALLPPALAAAGVALLVAPHPWLLERAPFDGLLPSGPPAVATTPIHPLPIPGLPPDPIALGLSGGRPLGSGLPPALPGNWLLVLGPVPAPAPPTTPTGPALGEDLFGPMDPLP